MKFLGGSPLSDAELATMSQNLVDTYGEDAKHGVNRIAAGEFEQNATGVNVAFGVMQILQSDPCRVWGMRAQDGTFESAA